MGFRELIHGPTTEELSLAIFIQGMQTLADRRKEINMGNLLKIKRGQGNTIKEQDGLLNRKYNCEKQV